jgi:CHAT domain-containing protein
LRARAWHAKALLRYANGDRRGAAAAIRAGLRILDEHRTTLNATDLRAHASAHRIELTTLGLRIAFDNGQPEQILEWAERGRASHLLLAPVRPPQDPILASLLADLRATVQDIDKARAGGLRETRLVQRQVALEMEIRDHCRRAEGELADSALGQVPAQQLTEALGEAALLEFIQLDDRLHVISIIDGRVQLRQLTELPPIRDLVDRIPFALRRLAGGRARPASRTAAVELLRHAAKQLDTALLWPLDDQIADRPLVLIPTGPLQSLPWAVLPSCAGRSVTVSPSAALWHAASRQPATDDGPVVVAAGPDLPGAYAEASAVGAIYHTPALAGPAATVDAVAAALSKAGLAHLAAHGRVQAQNPLFSSLRFADGPFTVYDLERLGRVPRLVVLAACDSGRTAVRPGDELLGLSVAFLNHGTQQLVASVAPIPDAETTPLMIAFHRLLAAGTPCPLALAQAQQQVASLGSTALATAAGFICIGAEYTIPLPAPPPRRSS